MLELSKGGFKGGAGKIFSGNIVRMFLKMRNMFTQQQHDVDKLLLPQCEKNIVIKSVRTFVQKNLSVQGGMSELSSFFELYRNFEFGNLANLSRSLRESFQVFAQC